MTSWSKRRRLEAVIAGEKPDRLPVALWRHWPGDDQDGAALSAAHLKWQQDYDWDLLKVGPASTYPVIDWGVQDKWVGHIEGNRERVHYPVQRPEDWEKLQPLDPQQGMLARQIEALRLIGRSVGEAVPFLATVFSPLTQAKSLAGQATMISHLRSHPDALLKGLETISESTRRFIAAARATGISGVFYAVQYARYPLLSRTEFASFGRAMDLPILEEARDLWLNMSHIHGDQIMFDLVADYPVALVNWHDRESGISLHDGLRQISGAASGGLDHWSVHEESPERLLAEAEDAVAQTDGRRLLLGTGCVIMVTTPTRNIRAVREFVQSLT